MFLNIQRLLFKTREQRAQQLTALFFFSRSLRFDSQHRKGSSQLSITPIPGDLMPSFGLQRHQPHMWCSDVHVRKTSVSIKTFCFLDQLTNQQPQLWRVNEETQLNFRGRRDLTDKQSRTQGPNSVPASGFMVTAKQEHGNRVVVHITWGPYVPQLIVSKWNEVFRISKQTPETAQPPPQR